MAKDWTLATTIAGINVEATVNSYRGTAGLTLSPHPLDRIITAAPGPTLAQIQAMSPEEAETLEPNKMVLAPRPTPVQAKMIDAIATWWVGNLKLQGEGYGPVKEFGGLGADRVAISIPSGKTPAEVKVTMESLMGLMEQDRALEWRLTEIAANAERDMCRAPRVHGPETPGGRIKQALVNAGIYDEGQLDAATNLVMQEIARMQGRRGPGGVQSAGGSDSNVLG